MDQGKNASLGIGLADIVIGIVALMSGLFGLVLLPYMVPLGGPDVLPPSELADQNGAFVTIASERLYYTHTPGPGPAILLIHGFGGSTVSWRDTVPALAEAGYDVYAVDLLGFGLSEKGWSHDYSHRAQAARVVQLMDVLAIEQAVILGHSMGGNVAAYVALRYSDRVDRLVLVSPSILDDARSEDPRLTLPVPIDALNLPPLRRWARVAMRELVVPQFDTLLFDAAYRDYMIDAGLEDGYRRVLYTPEWDLALLGIMRDAGENALGDVVRSIEVPVLLVWGAEDTWVPSRMGVQLEALLPQVERVEFAGVGHLPMHEVPDDFNRVLLDFLAQ